MSMAATIVRRLGLSVGLGVGLSAAGYGLMSFAADACGPAGLIPLLGGALNLYHFLLWAIVVPIDSIDAIASPVARTAVMIALPAVDWSLFFLVALSLGRSERPREESTGTD